MSGIDEALVAQLREAMAGPVVTPADEGYEDVRAIWNGQITTRPAAIASCAGAADVRTAVRFAREHDLDASVRGGGHAVAGHALVDDGLVVDLSSMTGVRVDPVARRAQVAGGALWSDVDRETQAHGLGVTGGIVTHTGVAGLTLGGGLGHLMRKYGLTIDSLRSCDVITADGEQILVSEEQDAELFWGLRGGGGNFGIVTSFEFDLHPVGPEMLAGMVVWPMSDAKEVLTAFGEYATGAPDEVGIMANLRLAPPLPIVPAELHGEPIVALVMCYVGEADEGAKVLEPMVSGITEPAFDVMGVKPYVAHQGMFDAALPHGRHYYWKSWKVPPLSEGIIDTLVEQCEGITSGFSSVPVFTQGGAVARMRDDATAYPSRGAAHDINIVASWDPEDPEPDRHIEWVRETWNALTPHADGVYVNFMSDEPQSAVKAAYGDERYARLRALKQKRDPDNFFRRNQNIDPVG